MPVSFQIPKKKTNTRTKRNAKNSKKNNTIPKIPKVQHKMPDKIENSKCFVSSTTNKLKIKTNIITHPPGTLPERPPDEEFESESVHEENENE